LDKLGSRAELAIVKRIAEDDGVEEHLYGRPGSVWW